MGIHSNLSIKDWMAYSCTTKDVRDVLQWSLKKSDEPMAVLSIVELIKRGDTELVTKAIKKAADDGDLHFDTHFTDVLTNTIMLHGSRDSKLKRLVKNFREPTSVLQMLCAGAIDPDDPENL